MSSVTLYTCKKWRRLRERYCSAHDMPPLFKTSHAQELAVEKEKLSEQRETSKERMSWVVICECWYIIPMWIL